MKTVIGLIIIFSTLIAYIVANNQSASSTTYNDLNKASKVFKINEPVIRGLLKGYIRKIRLIYQSNDPQLLEINGKLHVFRNPNVYLIIEFLNVGGIPEINITYLINGDVNIYSNGKFLETINKFKYFKSLILTLKNGSYISNGKFYGYFPVIVIPTDEILGYKVHLVNKTSGKSITNEQFIDVYLTKTMEIIINLFDKKVSIIGDNKTLEFNEIPTVYNKISKILGKNKINVIMYNIKSSLPSFVISPVMVERDTGIVLSFGLIGAPKVRANATIVYNNSLYDIYPVSEIGKYFNLLTPETFFKLIDIEIIYS